MKLATRSYLAGVVVFLALAVGAGSTAAAAPFPQHRCGSFVVDNGESEGQPIRDRVTVFNSDGLACRLATEVIEAFWDPEEAHHHHGGHFDYNSWWTTDRFPQWRCVQGAGGGECRHKQKVAGYSVKNA